MTEGFSYPSWRGDERQLVAVLQNFALHYEPLKQALNTLIDAHQLIAAAHLAQSLGLFWETQDYLLEGGDLVHKILDHSQADTIPHLLRARLYCFAGDFARHRADYVLAENYYEAVTAYLVEPDAELTTGVLRGHAEIAFRRGNYERAANEYQHYLALGKELKSIPLIADALNGLGRLATVRGYFYEADQLHQQGRHLVGRVTYAYGLGWHLNAVGELRRLDGRFEEAANLFIDSAALFEKIRDYGAQTLVQQNLAFTLLSLGRFAQAEKLFKQILPFWMRGSAKHAIALCFIGLAGALQARHESAQAARMLGFADKLLSSASIQLEMPDSLIHEQVVSGVSQSLGHKVYADVYKQGQGMPLEQLLTLDTGYFVQSLMPPADNPLTIREQQVMHLVAEGLTDKQIALQLGMKPQTVNVHLKSVYRKLDLHTLTSAALHFKKHYPT